MLLFVDPDTAFRGEAADALQHADFDVVEVDDAAAAREHLEAGEPIDCLVTEQRLPDGTGLELVREVRERSPDTACILCTEASLDEVDTGTFGDVVAEYLSKTDAETLDELVEVVQHSVAFRTQTAYPLPESEDARLTALERYAADPEALGDSVDRLTELATELFDVNAAAVGLVDEHEQRFLSCQGIALDPIDREDTVCTYAILEPDVTVVEDTNDDPRFDQNEGLRAAGIRFYASASVRSPEGHPIGTFCIYDDEPGSFSARQRELLELLAAEVGDQLVLRRELREARGETDE